MTEQESKLDGQLSGLYEVTDHGKEFLSPNIRKQILALIKETLPELAKEAGWVKVADIPDFVTNFECDYVFCPKKWKQAGGK